MSKRLIVVDISSFIFRAHYAIRPMHSPAGVPVNAVYGVTTMLMKLLNAYNPTHIILARDLSGPTFRNEKYAEYKANRGAPPEELVPQFSIIDDLIAKMQIPSKSMVNYEADDVIGSLVVQYEKDFEEILIASGDKDLMQFVSDKVKMLDTMKDKTYGPKEVFEKMKVHPHQIVDYLSLVGDSSDNIPGVKGIGAKGAADLLKEYGSLDNILNNIENLKIKRAKTALEKGKEMAHISRDLVTIVTDLKLDLNKADMAFKLEPREELIELLDELAFKSIKGKIESGSSAIGDTPKSKVLVRYELIKTEDKYEELMDLLDEEDQVFIEPFYYEDTYQEVDPYTISFSTLEKTYLLYTENLKSFRDVLLDLDKMKDLHLITNCSKALFYGMPLLSNGVFDIEQAHFVINPDAKHDLASICQEVHGEFLLSEKEIRKEKLEAAQSIRNFEYALAKRSHLALRAYPWLLKELNAKKLTAIFGEMDMPVNRILAKMEKQGIAIDAKFFKDMEKKLQTELDSIEKEIEIAAGEQININSPKQVGVLLFEKLGLPVIKKTKTGYSTDVTVLETLAEMGQSEVPGHIIKHRELGKLLSTYVKTLPDMVGEDQKIHSHFNQANASTGRLSSDRPNLQNIPIKTELGRKVRAGFVARPGHKFIGADYSQVELRILAHLSEDDTMIAAFKNDEDIHSQTAKEVFGMQEVSSKERSYAKAINFGLMYGQGSFGLSQMLKISPKEAKDYITRYFERFSKVKAYMDSLKESCAELGYTSTILGRQRTIKDINSSNRQVKSMAERMAINTPIQGTAADIIKKAMLEIDEELEKKQLKSKMLLQVHDELIFEVPNDEVNTMEKLVKSKMENVIQLKVPLKVDLNVGKNWYELK